MENIKQAPPTDVTPYEQKDNMTLNAEIKLAHPENHAYNQKIIDKYLPQFPKCDVIYQDKGIQILLRIVKRKIPDEKKYFQRLTKELGLIIQFQFEKVFYQCTFVWMCTRIILNITQVRRDISNIFIYSIIIDSRFKTNNL